MFQMEKTAGAWEPASATRVVVYTNHLPNTLTSAGLSHAHRFAQEQPELCKLKASIILLGRRVKTFLKL